MKCSRCKSRIPDGSQFCPECGNQVEAVEVSPRSGRGKGVKILAIALLAVAALASLFLVPRLKGTGTGMDTILYIKKNRVYGASLKKPEKEPAEYGGDILEDAGDSAMTGFITEYPAATADGSYKLYTEELEYTGGEYPYIYTLFYKASEKEEGVKIDSQIVRHDVTSFNQVVYVKNGNVYVFDLKTGEKEKVGSDLFMFSLDKERKQMLWLENDDPENSFWTLCFCDLSAKKLEKRELAEDVYEPFWSDDFQTIYLRNIDGIYWIQDLGEPEKLLNDVHEMPVVNWGENTFYYVREEMETINLRDMVEDDMAAADSEIQEEPRIQDYQHKEAGGNALYSFERTVTDTERYQADLKKYHEKTQRDWLRTQLFGQDLKLDVYVNRLYYYAGGKSELVSRRMQEAIWMRDGGEREADAEYIVYKAYGENGYPKVNLSQMSDTIDIRNWYREELEKSARYYVTSGGRAVCLTQKEEMAQTTGYVKDVGSGMFYFLAGEEGAQAGEYDLYAMPLRGEAFGTMEKKAKEVCSLQEAVNGRVYYTKDEKNGEAGDLYCNGNMIQERGDYVSVVRYCENGALVLMTETDHKDQKTLTWLEEGEKTEIGENISYWYFMDDNSLLFLTGYSEERKRGDLNYFDGKTSVTIDTGVRGVFCPVEAAE